MSARISQSMLFTNFVTYLNQTTSELQKLYEQGASQKKINRPSDNPAGMARVLSYRDSLAALEQYRTNINNSKGWLGLADNTLSQVEDQLTRLKELTVQASNGSMNEEDRLDILKEVKQIFDQLLALSNTTYEGKSIFAGHKFNNPAYTKGLAVFSNKKDDMNQDDVIPYVKNIQGSSDDIIVIEFSKADTASARIGIDDNINYTVTIGDSNTRMSGVLNAGDTTLDLGSVTLELRKGYEVITDESLAGEERTKLIIAPTAIYQGDNESGTGVEIHNLPTGTTYNNYYVDISPEKNASFDSGVMVKITSTSSIGDGNPVEYQYSLDGGVTWSDTMQVDNPSGAQSVELELPGGKITLTDRDSNPATFQSITGLTFSIGATEVIQSSTNLYTFAEGDIDQEIIVRIDSPVNFVAGNTIEYSYSLDGGQTWDRGHKVIASGSGYEELPIPNGVLKIAPSGVTNSLSGGEQFIIKPRDASIDSEISQDIYLPINHVGTEIFGGYYENSCGYEMAFATNEQKNLFVGIGKLIASLELNDQEGISNSLDYIDSALEQVGQMHADIGARLNRLKTSDSILADLQVNQMERKSFIEDVDFADLLTKISQQQTVYQTILKSASMIMKMSLVNYV